MENALENNNNANTSFALSCVNDGIVLGMKESLKVLHQFLDKKVEKGLPEYISRAELQFFMEVYIKDTEENLH
jgi:hypothetical protein